MFNITQYLQYKNTLDGKPRVLVEGVDYNFAWNEMLCKIEVYHLPPHSSQRQTIEIVRVANLSDCRPLIEINKWGKIYRELDILKVNIYDDLIMLYSGFAKGHLDNSPFFDALKTSFGMQAGFVNYNHGTSFGVFRNCSSSKIASFFDNPTKYSKLLWNCSETEGWEKVFKLLEIEL